MFYDDVLMSVADGRTVTEVIVQRAWNAAAVEIAEVAVSRNVISLYSAIELRVHVVELMERFGRVISLQQQR